MNYEQIIAKVKAFMDEVGAIDGGLLIDNDTEKPVDTLIAESLQSAWRSFALLCPLHLLPSKNVAGLTASNKIGKISLPADFIRIAYLKMESWIRPLNDAYMADGNLYSMQFNDFTKGMPTRPIAFLNNGTLECYSGTAGNEPIIFKYVADVVFNPESEDSIVPENIAQAFCYHVAGNVYDILGNQIAKKMYESRDGLCA